MAARGDNNFMRYVYRGEEGEIIPDGATHIIVHESVTVIRMRLFAQHRNIVEVICHDKVDKIEREAFFKCPRLRRVIIPGVKIVELRAFIHCKALTDVECDKLEIIKEGAFYGCKSLRNINLPSARIVESYAFTYCHALTDVKFGCKQERFEGMAFCNCTSLERITIPLRDALIPADNTFIACEKLKHVEFVEGELHQTIAALHLEEWSNDMNREIDSINQTLPTADAGYHDDEVDINGEKAVAIRTWIRSLLGKIVDYTAEHRRLMDEDVVPTLQRFVPQDIAMNNILPFLNLPSHTFEVVDRA